MTKWDGNQWCLLVLPRHIGRVGLEARLQEADKAGARLKLIATDGVFGMDAGLLHSTRSANYRKYSVLIFVNDCHST
jgi:glycine C-acetyltransferase